MIDTETKRIAALIRKDLKGGQFNCKFSVTADGVLLPTITVTSNCYLPEGKAQAVIALVKKHYTHKGDARDESVEVNFIPVFNISKYEEI